ncbi:nuclease [Glaciihabitans arcticus]|uniref:DNA 3'-5' helicase n=1 Tax=Glaciihabitans arcticus TaxID=2668039 RepID=A0A4Q9GRE6_9MICO|nr:3'-5' exonuclease [Glaciihabitans arcticus]TBN57221.1 nuclease [Glaciihabitans arcticus]
MAAGDSATFEAEHQRLLAQEHGRLAETAREMHRRFSAAAHSERRLSHTLEALESRGYTVLADRRWPKSRKAQVDFIVAGPGGVFIVDAKQWRDVHIAAGHVYRDQDDVTDDFARIADLAESTRSILAEFGLAPGEVHAYAVFTNQRTMKPIDLYGVTLISEPDVITSISRRGTRLSPAQVEMIIDELEKLFPLYGSPAEAELDVSVVDPVLPADVASITLANTQQLPLITVDEIEAALVEGVMTLPIEDWMAFLHPSQAKLVNRNFSGPSRVRGAAGTGKTVVGLHRAAHLARTGEGTVLVTTFVKTLPNVLSTLLQRMAPDVAHRVQFAGIYSFALDLLALRGIKLNLDPDSARRHLNTIVRVFGLLEIDPNRDYWHEEINAVIKGRGLSRFEDYAALSRAGRRRRLTVEQRAKVWDVYVAYTRKLQELRISDYPDVILQAAASLRRRPLTGYSAVIIDEAQDLTCMMIRMLHSLVGDKADGLNLIGDGQQTIYPGGFTLGEANISIAGRGVVMTTNYRNTAEIVEFAASLVAGDEFQDIEGGAGAPDTTTTIARRGETPTISHFENVLAHDASLLVHVRTITKGHVKYGDIGILAMTNWQVGAIIKALKGDGIPSIELNDYDGRPTNAVKVGTIHRAKGLEFKQVLVARTPSKLLDASAHDTDDSTRERRDLDRRALYVAMTRARDGLWVGVA